MLACNDCGRDAGDSYRGCEDCGVVLCDDCCTRHGTLQLCHECARTRESEAKNESPIKAGHGDE